MNRLILFLLLFSAGITSAFSQSDRDFVRRGNRLMRDTLNHSNQSDKAIVQYRKAVEANPTNAIAHYNMGNALILNGKVEDAMKEYDQASKLEKDKARLSDIYHNMGVIMQSAKQFDKAIAFYRQSLRNNPSNDETRYNYVLCQRQLKKQGNDNNQDQNKDNKDKQQQQQNQQDKKDKDNKDNKDKNDKQQQQQQQQQDEMSKENAEQMLQAAMQKEKETQEKVQRQQQGQKKVLQKQW